MSTAEKLSIAVDNDRSVPPVAGKPAARPRDPRLDFFRGLAMFFIYFAHCNGNLFYNWIPARFGPSDAADLFVFVSGMTVALAFGGTFMRQGWLIGTARIAYRCMQLYAAQIGMFCALAVAVIVGTHAWGDINYVKEIGFQGFFDNPARSLVGLVTLTYDPPYVDILPLYIGVLAMVPAVMALARIDPRLVFAASVALYLAANFWQLNLPNHAEDNGWHFDPFAWQLIFFTGFSLRRGWLKVPMDSRVLFWGSVAVLLLGLAISLPAVSDRIGAVDALRLWVSGYTDKTYLDPIRYIHFLALAYVTVSLLRGREAYLLSEPLRPIVKCGQQALSIFVSGMVLSHIGGMVFDHIGTGLGPQILVNGITIPTLIAIAHGVAWFKNAPWKNRSAGDAGVRTRAATPIAGLAAVEPVAGLDSPKRYSPDKGAAVQLFRERLP
jgi:hypothetical protein